MISISSPYFGLRKTKDDQEIKNLPKFFDNYAATSSHSTVRHAVAPSPSVRAADYLIAQRAVRTAWSVGILGQWKNQRRKSTSVGTSIEERKLNKTLMTLLDLCVCVILATGPC